MVRCWLVERTVDDRDLVSVVHATPDGRQCRRRELSIDAVARRPITAAVDVPEEDLQTVPDEKRDRYRSEAQRVREKYDPDEEI